MADTSTTKVPFTTQPFYQKEASRMVLQLTELSTEGIESLLHVNQEIALENQLRYHRFHDEESNELPAILAYTGIVFKRLGTDSFTQNDFLYAQQHLYITSFLYGLLRPLDNIRNYRLEGNVTLPDNDGLTVFDYWKKRLTDQFISSIHADDGILVNLASEEMKKLFDWKRICKEVQVITPEFRIYKNGKMKNIVIYTKMCRGEMTRYILKNRLSQPEELNSFTWEGFHWDEDKKLFINL